MHDGLFTRHDELRAIKQQSGCSESDYYLGILALARRSLLSRFGTCSVLAVVDRERMGPI